MTPTPKMRFIERDKKVGNMIIQQKILQQWWVAYDPHQDKNKVEQKGGVWRDVPLEVENDTQ